MSPSNEPVVLIVEDEPDVAETYRLYLDPDYDVRVAADGDEGLEMLDDDVDVVLLDRMMPRLSGDKMLERITERGLDCQVAMVTAVEPEFDILEMGFDAYLMKPVRSDELVDTVEGLMERATYDSLLQRYYALVEKQAALEASMSQAELAASEEYDCLRSAVDELQEELSDTLGSIEDDEAFIATIREFDKAEDS
jgi:DNA-binding response OmpR family regulator